MKKLYLACKYIYDIWGECPADRFDNMENYISCSGCSEQKCAKVSPEYCWIDYFTKKGKKKKGKTTMHKKFKYCPLCGSNTIITLILDDYFIARCENCCLETYDFSLNDLIEKWNTRVQDVEQDKNNS